MKDDTTLPQTFAESLIAYIAIAALCLPVIVTVWCINSLAMSTGLPLWASLPISLVVTALLMVWSISQQGNSLMEVVIAMFIVMVLTLVLVPVFHKAKENAEKRKLQMKQQQTPTAPPISSKSR